jgi:hypothetical protein
VHRKQGAAAVDGARDALRQHVHREGFEDVIGGRQFGGADHLAVHTLGGEHDEDGGSLDQLMVAQVLQQLLSILPLLAAQVVFAQDQVECLFLEVADGRAGRHAVFDARNAQLRQHIVQAGAHMLVGIDDQDRQGAIFLHFQGRKLS